ALHPERLRRHTDPSRPLQALQPVVCSLSQTSRLLSLGVTASHHRLSGSRSHRPKLPTSIVFDHRPCATAFLRRSVVPQQCPEQETSTLLRCSRKVQQFMKYRKLNEQVGLHEVPQHILSVRKEEYYADENRPLP